MLALPEDTRSHFLKGEHTVGLTPGRVNRIWTNQTIESTTMEKGHNAGGPCRSGNIMNPKAEARWALALTTELRMKQDLREMTETEQKQADGNAKHKEEFPGRINSDAVDRDKLRQKLDTVIDPLNPAGHPKSGPINIATGKLAHPAVNVHHSLRLGKVSREAYEKNLPAGFHDTINAGVKTMAYTGSRPKTSSKQVTNPDAIMNRALPMLSSGDVDLTLMFSTELSEVVTSLFQANGEIRLATDKSKLMQRLASYKSYRTIPKPDTVIIDGVAMLWAMYWPADGKVCDLVSGVASYLACELTSSDQGVHLIFDRYPEFSIKGGARAARAQVNTPDDAGDTNSTEFMLTLDSPLPPQSVCLKVTENKVWLISLITDNVCRYVKEYISGSPHTSTS